MPRVLSGAAVVAPTLDGAVHVSQLERSWGNSQLKDDIRSNSSARKHDSCIFNCAIFILKVNVFSTRTASL